MQSGQSARAQARMLVRGAGGARAVAPLLCWLLSRSGSCPSHCSLFLASQRPVPLYFVVAQVILLYFHVSACSPAYRQWGQIPGIIGCDEDGACRSHTAESYQGVGEDIYQPVAYDKGDWMQDNADHHCRGSPERHHPRPRESDTEQQGPKLMPNNEDAKEHIHSKVSIQLLPECRQLRRVGPAASHFVGYRVARHQRWHQRPPDQGKTAAEQGEH